MEQRQKIIGEFCDLILDEIEGAVKVDIPLNELKKYKNILVIRSVKNENFNKIMSKVIKVNPKMKMCIIGSGIDRNFFEKVKVREAEFQYQICVYDGRYDANRVKEFQKEIYAANHIDAVLFVGYTPHRETYLNVEEVAFELSNHGSVPIYAVMNDGQLYQYTEIQNHINGIRLYSSIVKWFHD